MLMIRLQRIGRTNDPSFRVVLTDKRNSPKSRNFVEILGAHDVKAGKTALNAERIKYWLSKGAKPSPSMHNFLITEKIISGKKVNVLPRKSPIKKDLPAGEAGGTEAPVAEAAPAAEVPKTEEPKAGATSEETSKEE